MDLQSSSHTQIRSRRSLCPPKVLCASEDEKDAEDSRAIFLREVSGSTLTSMGAGVKMQIPGPHLDLIIES